jgi:phosphoribosylamine--glycine ligase
MAPPFVLKADGLAAGKGVVICQSITEAETELHEMLSARKFGIASEKVVIEQFLSGTELSVFILTDGDNYVVLPEAKDYKRIGEGDKGPNTGGMGSVSPVPFADNLFMQKVEERIIIPTISGLKKENITYCGFIFFGLINVNGEPFVIEYNVRLGDPETESVLARLKNDLLELLIATSKKELSEFQIELEKASAVTIMIVSGGYPGFYLKHKKVTLPAPTDNVLVFHAGTELVDNEVLTNGGRVIAVTTLADNLAIAMEQSAKAASEIEFEGAYYRHDIGKDILN